MSLLPSRVTSTELKEEVGITFSNFSKPTKSHFPEATRMYLKVWLTIYVNWDRSRVPLNYVIRIFMVAGYLWRDEDKSADLRGLICLFFALISITSSCDKNGVLPFSVHVPRGCLWLVQPCHHSTRLDTEHMVHYTVLVLFVHDQTYYINFFWQLCGCKAFCLFFFVHSSVWDLRFDDDHVHFSTVYSENVTYYVQL